MPLKIQRIPRGLADVLSVFGQAQPAELEDRVRSTMDLLQFYANTQRQLRQASNPTMAEGAVVSVTVPAGQYWLLLGADAIVAKTTTMTALAFNVTVAGIGASFFEAVTFGATHGGLMHCPYYPDAPRLLLPGDSVSCGLDVLGTDATASCGINCLFGVMG